MANQEIRFGNKFGYGDVFPATRTLSALSPESRVEAMAWFHACPVRQDVVQEYGLEWTLKRYTECNWVYKYLILGVSKETNPDLYNKLVSPVQRVDGEMPDQNINPLNVPPSFKTEMSPLTTPVGYAIPRMILVGSRDDNGVGVKEKVTNVKEMLKEVIPKAKDPIELALSIGENLINMGVDGEKLMYHLMPAGILKEEGCKKMYREILGRMTVEAPRMYREYLELTENIGQMKKDGIITPDQLK